MALGWLWLRPWFPFGTAALCVAGMALGAMQPSLCVAVASMELGDSDLHFASQAWHLWDWSGSGGALGLCLAPWSPRLFAWQAWQLAISTFVLRGRRGTCHTTPFTHNLVLHHLSHTHIHNLVTHHLSHTHNFVTHHLSHTTLSHTIFHTQLCHTHTTLSHTIFVTTHNFVTHHLSHTIFVTHTHIFVTHNSSHTTV